MHIEMSILGPDFSLLWNTGFSKKNISPKMMLLHVHFGTRFCAVMECRQNTSTSLDFPKTSSHGSSGTYNFILRKPLQKCQVFTRKQGCFLKPCLLCLEAFNVQIQQSWRGEYWILHHESQVMHQYTTSAKHEWCIECITSDE